MPGLCGGLDKGIAVTDVDTMNDAGKVAGKPSSLTEFSKADYGFLADYRLSLNEAAAKEAWTNDFA